MMTEVGFQGQEIPPKWKIVSKQFLHADRVWDVYNYHGIHPDGREHDFVVIKNQKDWVQCLALTPDRKLLLVSQYRVGSDDITWELPGGGIDESEATEHAAIRELREETGYSGENPILLHSCFPNPASQSNRGYFYLLQNCKKCYDTQFDATEDLRTHLLPLDKLEAFIDQNVFQSGITLTGVLGLQRWLRRQG